MSVCSHILSISRFLYDHWFLSVIHKRITSQKKKQQKIMEINSHKKKNTRKFLSTKSVSFLGHSLFVLSSYYSFLFLLCLFFFFSICICKRIAHAANVFLMCDSLNSRNILRLFVLPLLLCCVKVITTATTTTIRFMWLITFRNHIWFFSFVFQFFWIFVVAVAVVVIFLFIPFLWLIYFCIVFFMLFCFYLPFFFYSCLINIYHWLDLYSYSFIFDYWRIFCISLYNHIHFTLHANTHWLNIFMLLFVRKFGKFIRKW